MGLHLAVGMVRDGAMGDGAMGNGAMGIFVNGVESVLLNGPESVRRMGLNLGNGVESESWQWA